MSKSSALKNNQEEKVDFYTAKNSGTSTILTTESMDQVYEYLQSPPAGTASLKKLLKQIVADGQP